MEINRLSHSTEGKGMSFFAFVFSVFFYSSIFYIFNISPSQLFNTTKFWFFISNTLILIIAADYGAFSTSKKKLHHQDLYQEYVMHTQLKNNVVSGYIARYPETEKEVGGRDDNNEDDGVQEESKMERAPLQQDDTSVDFPIEKSIEEVDPSEIPKENEDSRDMVPYHPNESCEDKHVVNEETKDIVVCEGKDDKDIAIVEEEDDDGDEFSRMSDEELNRRVEEFISKLKRQIRLQRTRDFSSVN